MKFTEHLATHITPEWRKQYINYEEMKTMLYTAIEQSPAADSVEPEELIRYFKTFDEHFFQFCEGELSKVNTFFLEKLAEASRRFTTLSNELSVLRDEQTFSNEADKSLLSPRLLRKSATRKAPDLKLAFSEFYLSLVLLQNYQKLNKTGFQKILKKYDKLLDSELGEEWLENNVNAADFSHNRDIDHLIKETEVLVTVNLEGGDRNRAMKRLHVPPLGGTPSPWTTFSIGLLSGAFVILLVLVVVTAIFHSDRENWKVICRLYRGPAVLILITFFWGFNIYGWMYFGINHVLIFELDPRNHVSGEEIIKIGSIFGVLWALSIICFFYSPNLDIPRYIQPLILQLVMIVFFFNPTKTLKHEARFWTIKVLGRTCLSPLFHVEFADFWVADQLSSLFIVLLDLQYSICFYITNHNWYQFADAGVCAEKLYILRPILVCIPMWFRFAQCIRRYNDSRGDVMHLVNAMKYFTSFIIIVFSLLFLQYNEKYEHIETNPYFYMWILSLIICTIFCYMWDIFKDWGLFDVPGCHKNLREETIYPNWCYYIAVIENFILRIGWTILLSVFSLEYEHGDLMICILAPLEILRRFIWNFFRLENEHLNNCGEFRAVRNISIEPEDYSEQIQLIRMMDEVDGVVNRRNRTKTMMYNFRYMGEHLSVDLSS